MLGLEKPNELPPIAGTPDSAPVWLELSESASYPESINRRIKTQLKFRATVDAGQTEEAPPTGGRRHYKPGDARNEALRREIFVRRDIIAEALRRELFSANEKQIDAEPHKLALTTINNELLAHDGHQKIPVAIHHKGYG